MRIFDWFKKKTKTDSVGSDESELKTFQFLWYKEFVYPNIEKRFTSRPLLTEIEARNYDEAVRIFNRIVLGRQRVLYYYLDKETSEWQKEQMAKIERMYDEIDEEFKLLFPYENNA